MSVYQNPIVVRETPDPSSKSKKLPAIIEVHADLCDLSKKANREVMSWPAMLAEIAPQVKKGADLFCVECFDDPGGRKRK